MDSALWLLLSALAVWRLTTLLCYETGPFGLSTALRRLLVRTGMAGLIACFHCCAFWVSAATVSILYEWTAQTPVAILAVAGAVSIAERWLNKGHAEEEDVD